MHMHNAVYRCIECVQIHSLSHVIVTTQGKQNSKNIIAGKTRALWKKYFKYNQWMMAVLVWNSSLLYKYKSLFTNYWYAKKNIQT